MFLLVPTRSEQMTNLIKIFNSLVWSDENGRNLQRSAHARFFALIIGILSRIRQHEGREDGRADQNRAQNGERKDKSAQFVKSPADRRAANHPDAEEGLQDGEHCGHVLRKLFGDHAEAAGEETGVSARLDDPQREREAEKDLSVLDLVQ